MSAASRNLVWLMGYRATGRALLFASYGYHFITAVRGLTPAEFGLVSGLYYGAAVLFEVPSGAWADHFGRRGALVAGGVATSLACLVFALAHGFLAFALGQVLFALGMALASGADSALLYDSLAAEGRETEYARAENRLQAAWLLGSAVGLPLADRILVIGGDPTPAVWATVATTGLSVLCALAVVEPAREARSSPRELTAAAVRDVLGGRVLLRIVVYSVSAFVLLRLAITTFFNPVLIHHAVPVDTWGSLLALNNLLGGLAAAGAARRPAAWSGPALRAALPVALFAMYAGLALWQSPLAIALFGVQGLLFGLYPGLVRGWLQPLVPSSERRATVLSLESLACRLATGGAIAVAGWSLGALPLAAALGLGAALGLLPLVLLAALPVGLRR